MEIIILVIFIVYGFWILPKSLDKQIAKASIRKHIENQNKNNTSLNHSSSPNVNEMTTDESTSIVFQDSIKKPVSIINDTTYNLTNENQTPFQDELKKSLVTQEELDVQENLRIQNIAISNAEYFIECIKKELLQQAKNAQIIEIEGRKYIESVVELHRYSYSYEKDYSKVVERGYLKNFLKVHTVNKREELRRARYLATSTCHKNQISILYNQYSKLIESAPEHLYTYSIDPEYKKMYNIFIDKLRSLANENGIYITPIIYCFSSNSEIPFESTSEKLGALAIKCRCIVPEKYSSDNTIKIDTIKDLNIVSPSANTDSENKNNSGAMISNRTEDKLDIDSMDGYQFEMFCGNLLRRNGFVNVRVTQGSGDQGIDIIAYKDDIKYGIQCKCYHSDIGNKAVQEAYSGKTFYGCHIGVVLTNRYFTRSATELAQNNGIILWDRSKLNSFIENANQN